MVQIGYTMMCEQRSPKDLVNDLVLAEQAGFEFSAISDHYHPWLETQGHSPYAWSVLGAAAQATERIRLMTYVTTPIMRYHPAIVAQKAATIALLSDGRFTLGLGAGERLNEHVVGDGWPTVDVRHEMLREAVEIIRGLFAGGYVTYHGQYYDVPRAKLFDLPQSPPEIGIAVSGEQSCTLAGEMADLVIATEPKAELLQMFAKAGGQGKRAVGQLAVCWGPDEDACLKLAHEQFRWSALGWKVQADLPNPANFEGASQFVRPEDLAETVPCGPNTEKIVEAVKQYADAGFTDLALNQIGDKQKEFCDFYKRELAPALRALGAKDTARA